MIARLEDFKPGAQGRGLVARDVVSLLFRNKERQG
jgi:hypothetical protein